MTRIIAYIAAAIVSLSYALDLPPWMAAALVAAIVAPGAALAVWDNLYGVHARTRQLIAEGRALSEETDRLPQSY